MRVSCNDSSHTVLLQLVHSRSAADQRDVEVLVSLVRLSQAERAMLKDKAVLRMGLEGGRQMQVHHLF